MAGDFRYIQYQGNSYMEFRGITLHQYNSISLQFQTSGFHGLLLYIEQKPTTMGNFVIQLSIKRGILEYQFICDSGDEIKKISTDIRVDDGQKYEVHISQDLEMCEAVVTVVGITVTRSRIGNSWSSLIWQPTGPIFIGGLPHHYATKQVAGSIYNFTGCIEVTEINNLGPYTFPNAVDKNNIDSCRFPAYEKNAAALLGPSPDSVKTVLTSAALPALFSVCQEGLCHNGGSCHQINLPDGVASFRCDCALHFTGRFCEKGESPQLIS